MLNRLHVCKPELFDIAFEIVKSFVVFFGGIIFECDPSQTLEIADMLMPYAMRVKIVTDIFGLQRAVYADTF